MRQMTKMELSRAEVYIIYSALNEICNGIEIPEFELRIGYPLDEVLLVFEKIKNS